jgi:hypothetical protein
MQSEEHDDLTPADRELEAALKSLSPARAAGIDPIEAAFVAGGRAARRQMRVWQSAAAAALVIAIGSWMIPLGREAEVPPPPTIASVPPSSVVVVVATAPSAWPSPSSHSLVTLQQVVHEKGVDGLPATELPTVGNLRISDLF